MRDAFGGVFMIRLMLVFLFIFVSFTALSLSYAKAFRLKNHIINFIEQEEIFSLEVLAKDKQRLEKLDAIIENNKYYKQCRNGNGMLDREFGEMKGFCYHGIVIEEEKTIDRTIVYKVKTYVDWNLGTLNLIRKDSNVEVPNGIWEISGNARVVKRNYQKK